LNVGPAWRRVPSLAGVAGPVLVVLAMRFLSGTGPASAPAAQTQIEGIAPDPGGGVRTEAALSERQKLALRWVASLESAVPEHSPMERGSEPERTPSPEQEVERPDAAPPMPRFTLRAVLGGGQRLAAINGRVYREGDTVRPGWRLTHVRADLQMVEIAGPGGQTVRISLSH